MTATDDDPVYLVCASCGERKSYDMLRRLPDPPPGTPSTIIVRLQVISAGMFTWPNALEAFANNPDITCVGCGGAIVLLGFVSENS